MPFLVLVSATLFAMSRESSSVCSELFVFKTRLKNCSCTSGELGLEKSGAEPIDDLKRFEKIDF